MGLDIKGEELRTKLVLALRAEGADVTIWQTKPLVANPLFEMKDGYGKGCPWTCPFYGGDVSYEESDYPVTQELLNNSIIVGTEPFPLFPQKMELMELYIKAFHKVFNNMDEMLQIDPSKFQTTAVTGRAEEL
jgi:hypothetical protein